MLSASESLWASEGKTPLRFVSRDLLSGLIVFLVALPLCLGIALASNAPLVSGLVSGVVGGILIGWMSGSKTSVSGPAAGLTAIVAAQITQLGAFETFLLAVILAGIIQIALGLFRAGGLAAFFPSSVIQGLLAAIGVILILKQLPHILGHDTDPEGEMSFDQPDHENTFTEIVKLFYGEVHQGAIVVGVLSLILLFAWDRFPKLKKGAIPAPLLVVFLGIIGKVLLDRIGGNWLIEASHLVQVPVAANWSELSTFFQFPDWTQIGRPAVWIAGVTICAVATLETLLNLEAVDKLDPQQRNSPPNRELIAQGCGNIACGLLGGIPVTSVIVRSSVNINAGARTKLSAIFHGVLLALCVVLIPTWLNMIPLAALAAILLHTGTKLVHPKLLHRMWMDGPYQFIPFIATLLGIVFTDLIIGVAIGLAISLAFILASNIRRPVDQVVESRLGEAINHVQLPHQVSFLNRAALQHVFDKTPAGTHLLIDASISNFIDPDILALIREYQQVTGPIRGVKVSTKGFQSRLGIEDRILYSEYSTRDLQQKFSPADVLAWIKAGNERFRSGNRLQRDLTFQIGASITGQYPLAVILGCIDSRAPAEMIFDVGLGELFSTRIAGNVVREKVLGSLEYACAVAGAKLVLVMGHTRCGAVQTAVQLAAHDEHSCHKFGCDHLDLIINEIQKSIPEEMLPGWDDRPQLVRESIIDEVARRNTLNSVRRIYEESETLRRMADEGKIAIVGALYHLETGVIDFMIQDAIGAPLEPTEAG
ncbi:MAG: SulP family inorganic anion transporter [Pirellula sp.]|nr:SulP family inorganic anion transporter [Pirellula sp.]